MKIIDGMALPREDLNNFSITLVVNYGSVPVGLIDKGQLVNVPKV